MRCTKGGKWSTITNYPPGSQLFTSSGTFTTPTGMAVTSARVFAVGGGGGGACGDFVGGAGGYVACGTFDLSNVSDVNVVVGAGGRGDSGGLSFFLCGTSVICVRYL